MQSRNRREGQYCGRTPAAEGGAQRRHLRSRTCNGHPPSGGSASLEMMCRLIRRVPPA